MPRSDDIREARDAEPGQSLAVAAEVLYLLNLLVLPGLAFAVLLVLYLAMVKSAPPLAVCHLQQTVSASLWAGVVLVVVNALIIALGGYRAPYTWLVAVLYFTICHSTLVVLGSVGLAKAMAGRAYRYPLVGRRCRT